MVETKMALMISVEEALKAILASVNILPLEEAKLTQALHRVLAEDVDADINIPMLDNSAMDGYALKSSNTQNASLNNPKVFEVIEDLRAGYVTSRVVAENQAIRIMTGTSIPQGADSVIMVEDTEKEEKNKVKIFKQVKPGENIRKAGEDIKKGERVLQKGSLLNSGQIGILASLGKSEIKVVRKPKIAILATGDEVIDVDEELTPGKLRSSNTYSLYSQVLKCGGIPKNLGIAKDNPEELEKRIKDGLDCDLILTSGGVSVGDYDLVKLVLAKMGADMKFWKVAMKPGKPLAFGLISAEGGSASGGQGTPVFGLPGNPVSSMVSFEVFVRPTILKMLGQKVDDRKEVNAVLQEDIKKKKGFRYFLRADTRWEDSMYLTRTTGPQGSGILKSMAMANSLIVLPEDEEKIGKGKKVTIRFLD